MRCAIRICSVVAATSVLAYADNLDDSSELFQASARLREDGPPEALQKMKQAIDKVTDALKVEVAELTKSAVREELKKKAEDQDNKEDDVDDEETIGAAELQRRQAVSDAEDEDHDEVTDGKAAEKVTLTLRLPNGQELVSAHSKGRMQVFMHSMCKKLGFTVGETKFWHDGKLVDPMSTAKEAGIENGAVLTITGRDVDFMMEKDAAAHKKAAEEAHEHELAEAVHTKVVMEKEQQKHKVEQKNAEINAEQQRKSDLKEQGRTEIEFVSEYGNALGESVKIAVKHDNWLQGTMELVCKRLGASDCTKVRFHRMQDKAEIKPEDSVKTLKLKDGDKIVVRLPFHKSA